jgi:hypothetical protein
MPANVIAISDCVMVQRVSVRRSLPCTMPMASGLKRRLHPVRGQRPKGP